ncbi:metallophosphoesterase family protein [Allostreptomyces psammosilenae]|uniref:3',5'-cyclic AMP phosphodiesterase CpdA n=1 Tax=Allostreptomyces psammosilenae TaxID=1892865 RepID=A0A853A219_9ACTN|nr:metallophosphoesterase [Allostreptomyces psammosilenae]NYI06934.1 3',5'-cyclic AMP phosphodiesterase CpdA [Allostreptomyces psammosilenae]
MSGRLLAVSDLHISYDDNRRIVEELRPRSEGDWLLVAGDIGEKVEGIEWTLRLLASRFEKVVWAPGNHELWTQESDPVQLRGEARYRHLVELCRGLGVVTPEDEYPVWEGEGGPVRIAPLFLLYDYTFRTPTAPTKEESLAQARAAGIVCTDEYLLYPDPYPSRDAWCRARVAETERRLEAVQGGPPLVFVNHYPLVRQPTDILRYPEFAQWCGTTATADWHLRFDTAVMVYGHLHIPRTTWYDGVRFEEVSLGYPREWRRHGLPQGLLRDVLRHVPTGVNEGLLSGRPSPTPAASPAAGTPPVGPSQVGERGAGAPGGGGR